MLAVQPSKTPPSPSMSQFGSKRPVMHVPSLPSCLLTPWKLIQSFLLPCSDVAIDDKMTSSALAVGCTHYLHLQLSYVSVHRYRQWHSHMSSWHLIHLQLQVHYQEGYLHIYGRFLWNRSLHVG